MSNSAYDCYLEASGIKRGLMLLKDDAGVKQLQVGLAPVLAPQSRFSANNLYEGQPPDVALVTAAERWMGGCGYVDYKLDSAELSDPHNLVRYNYSRGVDLSNGTEVVLSPRRNEMPTSTGDPVDGAPIQTLTTSLGTFMVTANRIYQWDTSALYWVSRDASGGFVKGACEFNGNVFVPRSSTGPYMYSSTGTTWTASALTDDNADYFCTRGDDGDAMSPTLNILVKLYENAVATNTDGTGNTTQWSSPDTIGTTSQTAKAILPTDGPLYVFKKEGIYAYDFLNVDNVWTAEYLKDDNADFVFMWRNGFIYANYGDRLLEFDPDSNSLRYVFPLGQMDSSEVKGAITGIGGDDDNLYLTVQNIAGNTYVIKGQPDEGWHTWAFPAGDESDTMLPQSGTDVAGVGTITWSDPGNIGLDDDTYATAAVGTSHYLVGSNYGFTIPNDGEIEGVEVEVGKKVVDLATPVFTDAEVTFAHDGGSGAKSITLSATNPATNNGDVMFAAVYASSNASLTPSTVSIATPPFGWALVPGTAANLGTTGGPAAAAVYYRIASSEPASYDWTASCTRPPDDEGSPISYTFWMTVAVYAASAPAEPINVAGIASLTGSGDTVATASAVTTDSNDTGVVGFFVGAAGGNRTWTAPAGMTERLDQQDPTSGIGGRPTILIADVPQPAAGSSGSKIATASGTVSNRYAVLVAISPVSSQGAAVDNIVTLWVSGSASGENKASASPWSVTEEVVIYGGPGDKWGLALTPALVNATNFGAALSATVTVGVAAVDYTRITVSYVVPGASRMSQSLYVAGPGAIHPENPSVVTGFGDDGAVYYILPRSNMKPQDDPNYRFEIDFGSDGAIAVGQWVDNGASAYSKFLNRGTLLGANMSAGKATVLSYETDGSPATPVLTAVNNGLTGVNIEDDVEYNRLRYIVRLNTTGTTTSPVILGWTFQSTINAPRYRVWNLITDLANEQNLQDGMKDYWQDSLKLEDFILSSVNKRVRFTDQNGRTYIVRILSPQSIGYRYLKVGNVERNAQQFQIQLVEIAPLSPATNPLLYGTDAWGDNHDWT